MADRDVAGSTRRDHLVMHADQTFHRCTCAPLDSDIIIHEKVSCRGMTNHLTTIALLFLQNNFGSADMINETKKFQQARAFSPAWTYVPAFLQSYRSSVSVFARAQQCWISTAMFGHILQVKRVANDFVWLTAELRLKTWLAAMLETKWKVERPNRRQF